MWRLISFSMLICVSMGFKNWRQEPGLPQDASQFLALQLPVECQQEEAVFYGSRQLPTNIYRSQKIAQPSPPHTPTQYQPSSNSYRPQETVPSSSPHIEAKYQPETSVQYTRTDISSLYNNKNNNNKQHVATIAVEPAKISFHNFSTALFNIIGTLHAHQNVVFSPISLQILLSWIYTAASGRTELELTNALDLPSNKPQVIAAFRHLLTMLSEDTNAALIMANKMYYNDKLSLESTAFDDALSVFDSEIEAIKFENSAEAAANINNWVRYKTANHIQELVTPDTLNSRTQAMLVNAIYFKAKWAQEFSTSETLPQAFYANGRIPTQVNMMYTDDHYLYGEFKDLNAQAVQMNYENSNISMLIILPQEREGLAEVEQRLRERDLKKLVASMSMESVMLWLPKFQIDFELDMMETLKQLGINELFTNKAQLPGFFSNQKVRVSGVQHKAYLRVNEAGSEAAAASFAKLIPLSLPSRIIKFTADHPFLYVIRSPEVVYFMGHVVNVTSS